MQLDVAAYQQGVPELVAAKLVRDVVEPRSLAPLNPRIARNYQSFLHSLSNPATSRPDWDLEWERDPDEASRDVIGRSIDRVHSETLVA
jgi:hypothetical protein